MNESAATVAVSIPCYNCDDYLEEAVESILAQTYGDVDVFVVLDGGSSVPLGLDSLMEDRRVRLVQLDTRMGPYFIHDLVLRASGADFLLIQDADDRSEPNRLEMLMNELVLRPTYVAMTSGQFYEGVYQSYASAFCAPLSLEYYFDRIRHHGLFRASSMLECGGYFGGQSYAFDSYITNALHVIDVIGYIDCPLYYRTRRQGSLSRSRDTGISSSARMSTTATLQNYWRRLYLAAASGASRETMMSMMKSQIIEMLGDDLICFRDAAVDILTEKLMWSRRIMLPLSRLRSDCDGWRSRHSMPPG